jgi:hypothetical protein
MCLNFALIPHLIQGVCNLLYMVKAEFQRVLKSSIHNAYAHIQKNYPKFLSEAKVIERQDYLFTAAVTTKNCVICASALNYFRHYKSRAELAQAIKVYFNQKINKIITVNQPSRIVLK